MNKRRAISGMGGLAILIIGILLDEHGMKLASQLFVMTAIAFIGPLGIALVGKAFRKPSFWIALGCCAAIHGVIIWRFLPSLPFSTLGVAILLGAVESFALLVATAKLMEICG